MVKDILEYNNAECLSCSVIDDTMIKIGPMIFCRSCWIREFGKFSKYDTQSPQYKKWIEIYKGMD